MDAQTGARPSLYRRPLPESLVAFASAEGRELFREALAAGTMEGFFALAEQFHTQANPSFCGLASLVVVLNALGIDPGRLWKGPWRWFSEELLDCCSPLDRVRERGLSMDELACLARCNGAEAQTRHPAPDDEARAASLARLRADVVAASRAPLDPIVVASYTRAALGQTGAGHFSPIGGYHEGRDLALVLDVARFKYPPHWVPLSLLHDAMTGIDPETGEARGWIVLAHRPAPLALLFCVSTRLGVDALLRAFEEDLPSRIARAAPDDPRAVLEALADALRETTSAVELRTPAASEHAAAAEAVLVALRKTEVHALLPDHAGRELAAAIALAAPASTWALLAPELRSALDAILARGRAEAVLAGEIRQLEDQLAALAVVARRRRAAT